MRKLTALFLALILLLPCAACGRTEDAGTQAEAGAPKTSERQDDIATAALGEAFYTHTQLIEGKLSYTVSDFRWSDNTKDLGVDPGAFTGDFDGLFTYWENGGAYEVPNALDPATGQLAEGLLFVAVDMTVTNEDARWTMALGSGDSLYTFPVDLWSICDTGNTNDNGTGWVKYHAVFYTGTENYDAAATGTNGSNYLIVRPGETVDYRLGYIIPVGSGDLDRFYLTDGGGDPDSEGDSYIHLDIPGREKG